MNILYLVPHVPNPTKTRSYYQVRGLLEAGHSVTVATLQRSEQDAVHIQKLTAMGAQVLFAPLSRMQALRNSLGALPTRLPLQARFMWSADLMRQITVHLKTNPPDIIHVEHLRMTSYGLHWIKEWPVVWDAVDFLTVLFEQASTTSASRTWQMIARVEAPRLRKYEPWLTGQFPATLVINGQDQKRFQANNPFAERIHLMRHGLPIGTLADAPTRSPNTLIMTGALDYHPNVAAALYFVREIFPHILRQRPEVKLQLVGSKPVPAIQALQSDQIEVTGFVPSLTDYLQRATVALAPITYGAGLQIKVIEAFFTETPLVATPVAMRGIDAEAGHDVLVAESAEDFAAAVLRLLDDAALRGQIAASGRRYVEQHHDLKQTTARLTDLYQHVIDQHQYGP